MAKRPAGKFTGSHTTVIDEALRAIDAAEKLPCVSKIVLGVITSARSAKPRLKFKEIAAGWEVVVYSKRAFQTMYIYSSDREAVRKVMEESFGK